MVYVKGEDGLSVQDLTKLDISSLHPVSPEIISRQATINIGTIGHVAHGKSTVVKAISGVQTVRFKNELERNITIKLGYANAKIYECDHDPKGREHPDRYCAYSSSKPAALRTVWRQSSTISRGQPLVASATRLVRGLPGARHSDGDDAERRRGYGRGAAP